MEGGGGSQGVYVCVHNKLEKKSRIRKKRQTAAATVFFCCESAAALTDQERKRRRRSMRLNEGGREGGLEHVPRQNIKN